MSPKVTHYIKQTLEIAGPALEKHIGKKILVTQLLEIETDSSTIPVTLTKAILEKEQELLEKYIRIRTQQISTEEAAILFARLAKEK